MTWLFASLMTGADDRWHPGIGDPTPMGWVTVVAYFTAAYLCFSAYRTSRCGMQALGARAPLEAQQLRTLARFWLGLCALLLLLGVNKQLDLQSLFTEVLRDMAHAQGWYGERRKYQFLFVVAIALGGAGAAATLAYHLRHVVRRVALAIVGVCTLVSFVVIRAASFHHIDVLLRRGSLRLNWVLELSGILMLGAAAYLAARPARGATAEPSSR
jgi:hypothetical protein